MRSAEAIQLAPDRIPRGFKVEGNAALGDAGLLFSAFSKTVLHFKTIDDEAAQPFDVGACGVFRKLPTLQARAQIVDLAQEALDLSTADFQQLLLMGDFLLQGDHGHV